MKTKRDETVDEVEEASVISHEQNCEVADNQTSTSESRSQQTEKSAQNAKQPTHFQKILLAFFAKFKKWLRIYPIVVVILICTIFSGTNSFANTNSFDTKKRYSDYDAEIVTELSTTQLSAKLEEIGHEYLKYFYEDCTMNYSRSYSVENVESAVEYKYKPQNGSYSFLVVIVYDDQFVYADATKYTITPAKYEKHENYEQYEKKISNRRNTETSLYLKTLNKKFFINFVDNKKTNTKIYESLRDTIICHIK